VTTGTYDWHGRGVHWELVGHGPPVVLCHGTPWSSWVWRSTAAALATVHRVYSWDMVGYGRSDKGAGDVSLVEQGHVLAALIDHWQIDRPVLVAHDFGGAVALRTHLLHGVAARALVLVDVVALRPWGSPFFRLVAEHADVFARLPMNLHAALLREYIAGAGGPSLSLETVEHLIEPWTGSPQNQAAFYRQIAQADETFTDQIEPLYPTIDIPTLIVWGADDTWIPVDRADTLHRLIPGSVLQVVPDAGHLIQEQQPDRLNALIATWLADPTTV
jgi:pimeloyl-ACP methyl ester carboxylesterase